MKSSLSTYSAPSALQQSPELVLDLAAVDASMLSLVGGKAANLGELIRAGLPAPPGVCVTTEAYKQVAASASIDFDALAGAGPKDMKRVARKAREALIESYAPAAGEGQP